MIKRIFSKNNFWLIFLILLIIPAFSSLMKPGYFPMHDDMQAMRLFEMDKCFKDKQIPCRWVPDMGNKYGYPQFNYYAPLPYYVMEVFHLLGLGYLDSVKAGFALSVVISALGMFTLGKSLWGPFGGFISAIFFVYAPYRALDMYVRGAVGEFWAMSFMPIIFWSAQEVFKGHQGKIPWLAFSLAALLTTHNLTSLIFTPLLVIWIIFLFLVNKGNIKQNFLKIKNLGFGILWGLGISAFFVLPAWFEKNFVHIETLTAGYFNYLAHFASLPQLLFSTYWGYGTSELGAYDDLSLTVGLVHWILPLVSLFLLLSFKRKRETVLLSFLILAGWFSLFLTHSKSTFIWNNFEILSFVQFPWRFLTLSIFLFSLAAGALNLLLPDKSKIQLTASLILIITVSLFYLSNFKPQRWLSLTDNEKFSGDLWQKQLTISIFDYLPIYAKKPPDKEAFDHPEIIGGEGKIISGDKGSNWQKWLVDVHTERVTLHLPLLYFPGWKVWLDGQETPVTYDKERGLVSVSASKGTQTVLAKLTDTPIRSFANLISLGGFVALPLFLTKRRKFK